MTDSDEYHCRDGYRSEVDYGYEGATSCTDIDNGGECYHCECCCSCLSCEYGPRGESAVGMTDEQRAPAAAIAEATR